jgi:hypothetical protein
MNFSEMIDDKGNTLDIWKKSKNPEQGALNSPLIKTSQKYFIDSSRVWIENPNSYGNIVYRLNDGEFKTVFEKEIHVDIDNTLQ